MKDSLDVSGLSPDSSGKHLCTNEILIRNQTYIISMSVHEHSKQIQMDLEVEGKDSADLWKATFDVTAIETMTAKTGNFKSFSVFINMLENAVNQESSAVSLDLFTYDDLESLRKKRQGQPENLTQPANTQLANKRYLILTYNAEYDRIYYPLSLPYCGKPDPVSLRHQIRQLKAENQLFKSRLESDVDRSELIRLQRECTRLKRENHELRQQHSPDHQQVELLRQMLRTSEEALAKERSQTQKSSSRKADDSRLLNEQIEALKSSERHLKTKVRSLTNEIALVKRNSLHQPRSASKERSLQLNGYSPRSSQQRPPRSDHLLPTTASRNRSHSNDSRKRSTSVTKRSPSPSAGLESRSRFNPTAYIKERNIKLRQIELQKNRQARRRRSSGRRGSDSDMSDFSARGGSKAASIASLRLNDSDDGVRTSNSRRSSSRKRSEGFVEPKRHDSTDSDLDAMSSPAILRKSGSNNATHLNVHRSSRQHRPSSSDPDHQNLHSLKKDSPTEMVDIDERLKSLEKFMKENLPS